MSYFMNLQGVLSITMHSGTTSGVSDVFRVVACEFIERYNFVIQQLQTILFSALVEEPDKALQFLETAGSSTKRLDFITKHKSVISEPTIAIVISFCSQELRPLSDLRNILCHETWQTSPEFPNNVIFSKNPDDAKLQRMRSLFRAGQNPDPETLFYAIKDYNERLSYVSEANLKAALDKTNLLAWCCMQIAIALNEPDESKRLEYIRSFKVFNGTSHLFSESEREQFPVNTSSKFRGSWQPDSKQ